MDDRAQRKATWMGRATSHMDTPRIRKEASDKFEKANPISSQRGTSNGRLVRPAKLSKKPTDDIQIPE